MNKQQVTENLRGLLEAAKASDFSGATAGTTEKDVEEAAIDLLQTTIELFELSFALTASLQPKGKEK